MRETRQNIEQQTNNMIKYKTGKEGGGIFLRVREVYYQNKIRKLSNYCTGLIQNSKALKFKEKERPIAAFHQDQLYTLHICFKKKPINNSDCLMLRVYSKDKTEIVNS